MKSKEIWMIIIVAAVVGVLSSVITVLVMNGTSSPLLSGVNANECTADGTCEMNSATLPDNGSVRFGHDGIWMEGGGEILNVYRLMSSSRDSWIDLGWEGIKLTGPTTVSNRLTIGSDPTEKVQIANGMVSVNSLNANSLSDSASPYKYPIRAAYVCVDGGGTLYRSAIACPQSACGGNGQQCCGSSTDITKVRCPSVSVFAGAYCEANTNLCRPGPAD